MAETITNVTASKPADGGALYRAPLGTALPSDATTALANTYVGLGLISEDGIVNASEISVDKKKAFGGQTVLITQTERGETFKFTLIETLNLDVKKALYGSDNVTGTLANGITVTVDTEEQVAAVWVIQLVLRGGVKQRIVIPNGQISDIGDITYSDDGLQGYEITIEAMPDASGNLHYEYVKSA